MAIFVFNVDVKVRIAVGWSINICMCIILSALGVTLVVGWSPRGDEDSFCNEATLAH